MKIYLDIDDTLLNTDMYNMRPANHLKEFLECVLRNHDVYWLTTHCNGDVASPILWMSKYVNPEIVDLIMRIKPTRWKVSKTEAIDFSEDFLWFDDILTLEDERKLEEQNKLNCYVKVDLDSNPDILKEYIK